MLKKCTKCKKPKNAMQDFYKRTDGSFHTYCKTCMKGTAKLWAEKNPDKKRKSSRDSTRKWQLAHPEKVLWMAARARAKSIGRPFRITIDDVKIPLVCPIMGILLQQSVGKKRVEDNSPSLDAIIPDRGYVPGNVKVISWWANRLKSSGSADEHLRIAEYIKKFSQ